jgi:tRNA A37 threonylcarbamoyladenosine dehydratase
MQHFHEEKNALSRFCRTELLIGKDSTEKLSASHVMVIGLGAVGSYAIEGLARAGIGRISLVDFDVVRFSNFNRQLYALESTINRCKVDVAMERIAQINPACHINPLRMFVDGRAAESLFEYQPNVIIDAFDSLSPKVHFMAACVQAKQNLISCLGAASRMDPFSLRIGDISQTINCPLARMIRKKLHKLGIKEGVRCVYSVEPPRKSAIGELPEEESYIRGRPRRPIGSISYIVGIVGLMAAGEAISQIINLPDTPKIKYFV